MPQAVLIADKISVRLLGLPEQRLSPEAGTVVVQVRLTGPRLRAEACLSASHCPNLLCFFSWQLS
jgi:hypothetical protein